jgi:hypothetical protein
MVICIKEVQRSAVLEPRVAWEVEMVYNGDVH